MEEALESIPGSTAKPTVEHPGSPRLFTVGIPVFNGRSLLRNCLRSVIDSTLSHDLFEIVVADDGSTEPETRAILEEFREDLAGEPGFFRVLYLGANSGGAARPRNRILDEAVGDYVFFVDSDDTIGDQALQRIGDALETTPADWVAVHQVPVNGRGRVCEVRQPHVEVPRRRALATLTVHKVFRRAEIERQQLRFDEGLPSGQDLTFAFSYLVNAQRFLMLGGYDFYHLTQHFDDPTEPAHLSRRAKTPEERIEKNERILRSMITALRNSSLPDSERHDILAQVVLPRVVLAQGYLKAIVNAGPAAGAAALRRLAGLLADPLVAGIDPTAVGGMTEEHFTVIARSDWTGLARLLGVRPPQHRSRLALARKWCARVARVAARRRRRLIDVATGRVRHRRVMNELTQVRRTVEDLRAAVDELQSLQRSGPTLKDLRDEHGRLEANMQAEFHLRDMLASGEAAAITPFNPGWQLSSQAMQAVVQHVLSHRPKVVVECGSGASTMWIGRALRQVGGGRVIALESSADWVAIVTSLLQQEGLDRAEVRHAPITPVRVDGREQPWYSPSALADIAEIDLLVVDGPPGRTSELARYPALGVLRDKVRAGATVMLDDCHRRDERETLRRWLAEFPELSLIHRIDHLAVLRTGRR